MIIKVNTAALIKHATLEGKHKFQWVITFSKKALVQIYDDPDIYKSDGKTWSNNEIDGFEIGVQQNKVPDRTGNRKARQIRRFGKHLKCNMIWSRKLWTRRLVIYCSIRINR